MQLRLPLFRALASACPRRAERLRKIFTRLASNDNVTVSVYGPLLETRNGDATFHMCATASYGHYFSDFLLSQSNPFSFVDIGANIGIYSLIASTNHFCRNCFAFEPNPEIFKSMTRNIALNKRASIMAINVAISSRKGPLQFKTHSTHSGIGSINPNGSTLVQAEGSDAFDRIASEDPSPKIVKIDVEGHEPIVIEQLMRSAMWPQVGHLYFEAGDDRYDVDGVVRLLERDGFKFVRRNESFPAVYDLMFAR